jgi:hypothetical protein
MTPNRHPVNAVKVVMRPSGEKTIHTHAQKRMILAGRGAFGSKRPIVRSHSVPNKHAFFNSATGTASGRRHY